MNVNCSNYIFLFFILTSIGLYSQSNYSDLALTGRGDLELEGTKTKLHPEAYEAFLKMKSAALNEGVSIKILSAYRSFSAQKVIWNRKYKKLVSNGMSPEKTLKKIIEYSTLPGTSRHHWGTEIDVIDDSVNTPAYYLVENNFKKGGPYEKLKNWMDLNSEKFGFYLVYTNNTNRKGFKYEPWHYSYKPISYDCFSKFVNIDLLDMLKTLDVNGSNYLTSDFINNYLKEQIRDINPKLK